MERLKVIGGVAFAIAIFLASVSLLYVFIMGAAWAAGHLLRPLIAAGWWALGIVVVLLLPLSVFRALRPYTGGAIFLSSYLFGLIAWLGSFVLTYLLWGLWAVLFGLVFVGGGVVPMGLLATLFKGQWQNFWPLLVLVALTFGTRIGGAAIIFGGAPRE